MQLTVVVDLRPSPCCLRGERLCDGHWDAMIREGRIAAILPRLEELRNEASATSRWPNR